MKKSHIGITVGTIFFLALGSWTLQQFAVSSAGDKASSPETETSH